jgi:DNA-binding CsgD family transcriptional regulator
MAGQIQFSEREKQVIEFLIQGKSNKQIALALGISLRTVEFHLSNIYAKLGVTSRTEAALKLSEVYLRESTGGELRESTVLEMDDFDDNIYISIFTWRIPMKKSFIVGLVILIATAVFCLVSLHIMAKERGSAQEAVSGPTGMPTATLTTATETPLPTFSPKEHILEQIRQLAAEYEQAVQAEKQNGDVEFSKDPTTGEEVFIFQGDSFTRISNLRTEFHGKMNGLIDLYAQIYRDETNPTPFPSPASLEQKQPYLNFLYEQAPSYCPTRDLDIQDATIVFYDPDDGKYHPLLIDDEMARCYIYSWMIEEWRTAPQLAKVNKQADMALIRQMMGKPGLNLTFQSISEVPNAPWRSTALYTDGTGTRYYVDVDMARLAAIEPNFPGHPNAAFTDEKSMDELRGIARQFASTNSPRLADLEPLLLYEENCKGDICFFRWDYRNKDWSGTDWVMMPPFLQVGVLADGQIVTYNNTLDLFE